MINTLNVIQHKMNTKETKARFFAFYDIRPGNGSGLFSKEKISNRGDKYGKVKKNIKWVST